jgi:hypothetical protein
MAAHGLPNLLDERQNCRGGTASLDLDAAQVAGRMDA